MSGPNRQPRRPPKGKNLCFCAGLPALGTVRLGVAKPARERVLGGREPLQGWVFGQQDLSWIVEDSESIKGEMSADDARMGVMTCDLYRPYELTYDRPLTEAEHRKWFKRVEKKVEELEKQQK